MRKTAVVGAFMLAAIGASSVSADQPNASDSATVITSSHIGRLKSTLRLTADQERHWPPVERALRAMGRPAHDNAAEGFRERVSARASALAARAAGIRRVWAAAGPLIKSLDPEQKRDAMSLARALGVSH